VDVFSHFEDHFPPKRRTGRTFRISPFMNMILQDLNLIR
jgi:hypothetical protein